MRPLNQTEANQSNTGGPLGCPNPKGGEVSAGRRQAQRLHKRAARHSAPHRGGRTLGASAQLDGGALLTCQTGSINNKHARIKWRRAGLVSELHKHAPNGPSASTLLERRSCSWFVGVSLRRPASQPASQPGGRPLGRPRNT